jgi:hypothetical protein
MARLVSSLFILLSPLLAFAQAKAPAGEPPVEHASVLTVVVFLGLFFGSILAYAAYLWWRARSPDTPADE